MYFITIKRMLEVCFSAHPNIQYRASLIYESFLHRNNVTIFSHGAQKISIIKKCDQVF